MGMTPEVGYEAGISNRELKGEQVESGKERALAVVASQIEN